MKTFAKAVLYWSTMLLIAAFIQLAPVLPLSGILWELFASFFMVYLCHTYLDIEDVKKVSLYNTMCKFLGIDDEL